MRDLYFLDESGFARTMPTGCTWPRTGLRAVVPPEDKKGRRVNVLGALSVGMRADLVWEKTCGKVDAAVLLEFVCARLARLPGGGAVLAQLRTTAEAAATAVDQALNRQRARIKGSAADFTEAA